MKTGEQDTPKLSICMIVKNEEANLKRCLDSILPLVHEPWCELVILDTGSADRTMDVARAYTDLVFQQAITPWDFSEARNLCASYATGDRIMVIDADEVLLPDSLYVLEDRILNPQYADRKTIFFEVRSYFSNNLQLFTPMLQPRVFNRTENPIYSGAAHNRPEAEPPYLYAHDIVLGHYGYLWANQPGLMEKKYDRTLPLLLEEYERDPHSIHALGHLVKTYFLTGDNANVVKFGELFLEELAKADYHDGWIAYLESLVKLLYVYAIPLKDEKNALRVYRESLKYTREIVAFPYLMGKYYAMKEPSDRRNAAYYYEECIRVASSERSPHVALMNSNDRQIIPEAMNFLACWHFSRGEYSIAGDYATQGIRITPPGLEIRWDVWNEEDSAKMLKQPQELAEV